MYPYMCTYVHSQKLYCVYIYFSTHTHSHREPSSNTGTAMTVSMVLSGTSDRDRRTFSISGSSSEVVASRQGFSRKGWVVLMMQGVAYGRLVNQRCSSSCFLGADGGGWACLHSRSGPSRPTIRAAN